MNEQTTSNQALGMIEVRGRIGAIEGLDAALKAANVRFVNMAKVGGGLTAVFVEGEVGAVKAAVEAGGAAADRVSELLSVHIIPRPAAGIKGLTDGQEAPVKPAPAQNIEETTEENTEENADTPQEKTAELPSLKDIQGYNVSKLRALARSLGDLPMTRREINFAKREDIMKLLEKRLDGGSGK